MRAQLYRWLSIKARIARLNSVIFIINFLLFLAFTSVVFLWLRTLDIIKSPEFFIMSITCSVLILSAGVIYVYIYISEDDLHILRLPAGVAGFGFALFLALIDGKKRR